MRRVEFQLLHFFNSKRNVIAETWFLFNDLNNPPSCLDILSMYQVEKTGMEIS